MARLRAFDIVQEQESRRKSNCLQIMQGRISETAQDREERLECQRNVTRSSRMAIWKVKKMLPTLSLSYNP
ncbi:hypothetical protein TNCV_565171 [Trichonephila clavipes]|nr:hypothetical protein TNCV_565171 [Trichonephila clavipes]